MLSIRLWSSPNVNSQNRLGIFQVVPNPIRCMQCGICSYNCPAGIDVRAYAWQGLTIDDSACLTCGQCVIRCPRRVLKFEPISLFDGNRG